MIDHDAHRQLALDVLQRLRAAGYVAYWAGGCVRDQLLKQTPKDYDVATSAVPDQVRDLFGHKRTLAIGASFGVISVLGPRPAGQIDVATFREDRSYSDGRHPDDVIFGTPEIDAQRRDFTINGLFFDPVAGEVIDYVGGRADLDAKIVRAIGDPHQRFTEDKLRMLRAVRFTATYEFELDAATRDAVQTMAPQISVVSAERIGAECARMLLHKNRARAAELLRESRLLAEIMPEVDSLSEEAWQATLRVLAALAEPTTLSLALAALVRRAAEPHAAEAIALRLRLTNKESARAQWLIEHFADIEQASETPWPKLQRLLIAPGIEELLALYAAETSLDNAQLVHCHELLALPAERLNPAPLITGDDLKAMGLKPGKDFRDLLERARDAQLTGEVKTRDEALSLVQSWLP